MNEIYRLIRTDAHNDTYWYNKDRELHRLDGPAIVRANGIENWFIDGVEYTEDEFLAMTAPKVRVFEPLPLIANEFDLKNYIYEYHIRLGTDDIYITKVSYTDDIWVIQEGYYTPRSLYSVIEGKGLFYDNKIRSADKFTLSEAVKIVNEIIDNYNSNYGMYNL